MDIYGYKETVGSVLRKEKQSKWLKRFSEIEWLLLAKYVIPF